MKGLLEKNTITIYDKVNENEYIQCRLIFHKYEMF